jgi:hypothetical protein
MSASGHGPTDTEALARDEALDALEASRSNMIRQGRASALRIALMLGYTTSTMVFEDLRARGLLDESVDPRWMGAVFRGGWKRVGWQDTRSHKRRVAMWALDESGPADLDQESYQCGWNDCMKHYGIKP